MNNLENVKKNNYIHFLFLKNQRGRGVQTRLHQLDLRRTGSEKRRRLLARRFAADPRTAAINP